MAETLTRQPSNKRSRRGKTLDPRERELKRLKLSVCDDVGFRLYLATYDQPKRRDELIARVVMEAEAQKVRVTRLDLAKAGPETNLVGLLRAHLAGTDLPHGWRQGVMVTGIEQRLDYSAGSEGAAFLHQANLLRDALPEAAPVPVVLWLSRMASASLPAEAPDLWHWRAANFDFTGDEAPRLELLRELTAHRREDEGELSTEQRRAHVQVIEDLLAELEREGPPKSKRQAAERADLLDELVQAYVSIGRYSEALRIGKRQIEIARQIGDRSREAMTLSYFGDAFSGLGEPQRAIEHYEEALGIARQIGDRTLEGWTHSDLGAAHRALWQLQPAIEHFQQALVIAREIEQRRLEGWVLSNLGGAHRNLGGPQRAIEYYEKALRIARDIGDRVLECSTLFWLADAYHCLGEAQRAIEHCQHALVIAREIGYRRLEGWVLSLLGAAWLALGEPQRAMEHAQQALEIAREIGDRRSEAFPLSILSDAWLALGEPQRAMEQGQQALEIAREVGDRQREVTTLSDLGDAYHALGELQRATESVREALTIAEHAGEPNLASQARAKLAEWDADDASK